MQHWGLVFWQDPLGFHFLIAEFFLNLLEPFVGGAQAQGQNLQEAPQQFDACRGVLADVVVELLAADDQQAGGSNGGDRCGSGRIVEQGHFTEVAALWKPGDLLISLENLCLAADQKESSSPGTDSSMIVAPSASVRTQVRFIRLTNSR